MLFRSYHYGLRWYNDFTENCVVFLLTSDDVTAPTGADASMLKTTRKVIGKEKT